MCTSFPHLKPYISMIVEHMHCFQLTWESPAMRLQILSTRVKTQFFRPALITQTLARVAAWVTNGWGTQSKESWPRTDSKPVFPIYILVTDPITYTTEPVLTLLYKQPQTENALSIETLRWKYGWFENPASHSVGNSHSYGDIQSLSSRATEFRFES